MNSTVNHLLTYLLIYCSANSTKLQQCRRMEADETALSYRISLVVSVITWTKSRNWSTPLAVAAPFWLRV